MFKYLEPIKTLGLDDQTCSSLAQCAYEYFKTKTVNPQIATKKEYSKALSCFVRFFGLINPTKNINDPLFQLYLKNEALKGKPETLKLISQYIQEILQIHMSKVLFSSPDIENTFNAVSNKYNNKGEKIRYLVGFDYKIEVIVSSNYSNKILTPQIYFIMTLDDGEIIKMKVELRMFNEFRKDLSLNIKRILANEGEVLLK